MIVVKPLAGLCNRMSVINSCIELQKRNKYARAIKMLWEKDETINCDFVDLFQPIDNVIIINSHQALQYFMFYRDNKHLPLKSKIKKVVLKFKFLNYSYYDNESILPLRFKTEYWDNCNRKFVINTCSDFYHTGVNNYQLLKPVSQLQFLIEEQVKKFIKPTIGVHIRRGDHVKSVEKSTNELFIKAITDLLIQNDNQLFFLATDDPGVEILFKEKFRSHLIVQDNKDFSRGSKKGIQDALVDLYTLSRTKKIIGSYYSSFSWMASMLNRIPLQIIE